MIIQGQDDQLLLFIFLAIAMIIPGIVLWFDDSKIHRT